MSRRIQINTNPTCRHLSESRICRIIILIIITLTIGIVLTVPAFRKFVLAGFRHLLLRNLVGDGDGVHWFALLADRGVTGARAVDGNFAEDLHEGTDEFIPALEGEGFI